MLADVLCQITGTSEKYSSPVPEPFTYVPEDEGTVETANGNTTSAFLELFGRSPRDTGLALRAQPVAQRRPAAAPAELQPHSAEDRAEPHCCGRWRVEGYATRGGRRSVPGGPFAAADGRGTEDPRGLFAPPAAWAAARSLVDLVWALINSEEFLYRH